MDEEKEDLGDIRVAASRLAKIAKTVFTDSVHQGTDRPEVLLRAMRDTVFDKAMQKMGGIHGYTTVEAMCAIIFDLAIVEFSSGRKFKLTGEVVE